MSSDEPLPPLAPLQERRRVLNQSRKARDRHWNRFFDPLHVDDPVRNMKLIEAMLGEIMLERLQPSSKHTKVVIDVTKETVLAIEAVFGVHEDDAVAIALMFMALVGVLASNPPTNLLKELAAFDKDHQEALRACASNPIAFVELLTLVIDVMLFRRDAEKKLAVRLRHAILAHYTETFVRPAGGRKKPRRKKTRTRRLERR